jgi:diacylglycerol kinase family enzyme
MNRLVIVYNKNSTKYPRVKTEILNRLRGKYTPYEINTETNVDGNAAKLAPFIQSGDRIIAAGGDGTATICINAIIGSNLADEVTFGVLPYGNFNDMARCFGRLTVTDILADKTKFEKAYPLRIYLDEQPYRYGMCYVTIGLFAASTRIFDEQPIRQKMRAANTMLSSLISLAQWYYGHRKEFFLPPFKINGRKLRTRTTDYLAVNCTSMAGVMRNKHRFYLGNTFLSGFDDLSKWGNLANIMSKSVGWQIPGNQTYGDILEFSEPATVEIQSEGEYAAVTATSIAIRKSKTAINVLTHR